MKLDRSGKIRATLLCLLTVGAISALTAITFTTPTTTAQVGVLYSSACTASGGTAPYSYIISSGALPPGLAISGTTGNITGTPTTTGAYTFTCFASDSTPLPTVATAANANRRTIAKSATPALNATSGTFTITVAPAASPTPVPPSIWMAAMGLAGAGLFRMRQLRRA